MGRGNRQPIKDRPEAKNDSRPWTRGDKITLIGLIITLIAAIATVLALPEVSRFLGLIDSPRSGDAQAKDIYIESLWGNSTTFQVFFHEKPPVVLWGMSLAVTNLEQHEVGISAVIPKFNHISLSDGRVLELRADPGAEEARSFATLAELSQDNPYEDNRPSKLPIDKGTLPPFLVKAGEKRYFRIDQTFYVYVNDALCGTCAFDQPAVIANELLGGRFRRVGGVVQPLCDVEPRQIEFRFVDGRAVTRELRLWIAVDGCTQIMPRKLFGRVASEQALKKFQQQPPGHGRVRVEIEK